MAAMKLEDSEFPMEIDDGEDTDTESPMEVDGDKTTDVETVGIRSLIEMKAVYRHSVSGAMFDSEVRCETSSPGSSLMVTMHVICSRPHWFNHWAQIPVSPIARGQSTHWSPSPIQPLTREVRPVASSR